MNIIRSTRSLLATVLTTLFFFMPFSAQAWDDDPNWVVPGWIHLIQGKVKAVGNFKPGDPVTSASAFGVIFEDVNEGICASSVKFHLGDPLEENDPTSLAYWVDKDTVDRANKMALLAFAGNLSGVRANVYGLGCNDAIEITIFYE